MKGKATENFCNSHCLNFVAVKLRLNRENRGMIYEGEREREKSMNEEK